MEELDLCPPLASLAEGPLLQEVLPQAFLDPMNAMEGFLPPRPEPFPPRLCSPDLIMNLVCAQDREEMGRAGAGVGLLGGKPAEPAGSFLPSQQGVSTGTALSCPTTCLGQDDVLTPFLEAGLNGFLEEGRQDKASIRGTQGKEEDTWLLREPGQPAVGEQVCLHSWQVSGFQSTFCFCHISQSLTLAKATVHQAFQSSKLSICNSHLLNGYHWLCVTDKQIEAPRGRSHAQTQKG